MTKYQSNVCKGIAILMMYFHHLFIYKNLIIKYDVSFWPFSQPVGWMLGLLFKACVAIFAFITGYGYCKKKNEINHYFKMVFRRLTKLMFKYWFVFILFFIIGIFTEHNAVYKTGNALKTIFYVLADFFGLSYGFKTPTMNNTWWYITIAIILIVVSPSFIYLSKRKTVSVIVLAVIIAGGFISPAGRLNVLFTYLLPLELGIICAQYSVFEKIKKFFDSKHYIDLIVSFVILGTISYYREFVNFRFLIDAAFAVLVCYIVFRLTSRTGRVSKVLYTFGKYSANGYLIHGFILYYYFKEIVYSTKYFLAIWVLLAVVMLGISWLIEKVKKIILYNKLENNILEKMN